MQELHRSKVTSHDARMHGIGARIASIARPSEVLVSQTVINLVAGSGLTCDDAGERALKGRWHLYRVAP